MKRKVSTDNAPKAEGLLSQAVISNDFIFVAGQIHNTSDGTINDGTVEEKTHKIIKNIEIILKAANASLDDVVKVTIYVTDITFGTAINDVYKTYFNKEPLPAREMICVKALPLGANIEMSVIAVSK